MKALVTGSTGFLGKNLVEELLKQGWTVWVLHRKSSDTRFYDRWNVEFVEGDITDPESLHFPQVDCVFHTAADSTLWRQRNILQNLINIEGTRNVVAAIKKSGISRLVHTSTAYVWGLQGKVISEVSEKIGHQSPINFIKSKLFAEQEALRLLDLGLEVVIVNPCHIMGPYDENNWAQVFRMIAGETLPRVPPGLGTFCHVQEVAKAHIKAFEKGRSGQNYILGGEQISYFDLAQKMAEMLHVTPPRTISTKLLTAIGRLQSLLSRISQVEPVITYEKARFFSADLIVDGRKAENELMYHVVSIDKILQDCCRWLVDEQLLQVYRKVDEYS